MIISWHGKSSIKDNTNIKIRKPVFVSGQAIKIIIYHHQSNNGEMSTLSFSNKGGLTFYMIYYPALIGGRSYMGLKFKTIKKLLTYTF